MQSNHRAVDEALSNIMRHSYHGRLDQVIEISCRRVQRPAHGESGQGIEIQMFESWAGY